MGEMKIKSSPSRKAFLVFDTLLMILLALICIYPFWYVLCYSFSDTTAASVNPPVIHPAGFTLSNYKEILTLKGFFPALGMSVLRTVVGTGLSVFCCSFLAYLFTKLPKVIESYRYHATIRYAVWVALVLGIILSML